MSSNSSSSNWLSRLWQGPALAPMQEPVFRMLWVAWLFANMTMWMNDVAAAWLMTNLTTSPVMVALVQTASTLPVFLLGIPSGAMADIVDRRKYFAVTQLWVSVNALVLAGLSLADALSAPLLLGLTFVNGVGLAMRWPVFSAIVPEIVGKERMPAALALNGISMNLSRVVGPALAGSIISAAGSAAVFVLNTLLALVSFVIVMRWRTQPKVSALPGERFVGAMRVGLQHVRQSSRMKIVMMRVFLFFFQATALMALLPLVAKRLHGGGPGTFTAMLGAVGVGAVAAALYFPQLRAKFSRDEFVRTGTIVHAVLSVVVVWAPEVWIALIALLGLGAAWISTANSLSVSAQMALPDWVRARGMSIYQMALMGGAAFGSVVWGQVAQTGSVRMAVEIAAVLGPLIYFLTAKLSVNGGEDVDFSLAPPRPQPAMAVPVEDSEGPVMVTIEYHIDMTRRDEFVAVMEKTRRARLSLGVLSWGLFRDTSVVGCYVEYFVDENWVEHQRRLARFTADDYELSLQRRSFQLKQEALIIRRYVSERAG